MSFLPTDLDNASQAAGSNAHVQVFAVGPWHEKEFQLARPPLDEAATWQQATDIDSACECLLSGVFIPELILLAQPLPGQYHQKQIDRLQALAPLARIMVVAGSWCEGGLRSGTQLTGVLRLYWHEFAPWWKSAQAKIEAGLCPPWSQPLDDPLAVRSLPQLGGQRLAAARLVAISATDFAVYESLSAALEPFGVATVWSQPGRQVGLKQKISAGIWDGSQLGPKELEQLADFCSLIRSRAAVVVALLDYPRVEHFAQAQAAGASAVFGKPYVVDELFAALRLE